MKYWDSSHPGISELIEVTGSGELVIIDKIIAHLKVNFLFGCLFGAKKICLREHKRSSSSGRCSRVSPLDSVDRERTCSVMKMQVILGTWTSCTLTSSRRRLEMKGGIQSQPREWGYFIIIGISCFISPQMVHRRHRLSQFSHRLGQSDGRDRGGVCDIRWIRHNWSLIFADSR
jgi:hypothetical protein